MEQAISCRSFVHPMEKGRAYKFASLNINGKRVLYILDKRGKWIETNFRDFDELISLSYQEV